MLCKQPESILDCKSDSSLPPLEINPWCVPSALRIEVGSSQVCSHQPPQVLLPSSPSDPLSPQRFPLDPHLLAQHEPHPVPCSRFTHLTSHPFSLWVTFMEQLHPYGVPPPGTGHTNYRFSTAASHPARLALTITAPWWAPSGGSGMLAE